MQPLTWSPSLFETMKLSKRVDAQLLSAIVKKSSSIKPGQLEEKKTNNMWA